MESGKTPYSLLPETAVHNESTLYVELFNKDTGINYLVKLTALKDSTFRLHINERSPLHPRYEVEHALSNYPQIAKLELVEKTATHITIANGPNKAILYVSPFRVDFYSGSKLVISTNARGLMRFEHLRPKPET